MWPCGVIVAGSGGMERDKAWTPALYTPDRLGPKAINYYLIEGYFGDTTVTEQRTEVVIEEGVPFSCSLFPARELHRLEQYWSWREAVASIASPCPFTPNICNI